LLWDRSGGQAPDLFPNQGAAAPTSERRPGTFTEANPQGLLQGTSLTQPAKGLAGWPKELRPWEATRAAQTLKAQLSGVKVYKVGDEAEKQVFVVGKTADGQWAGRKTSVVET
jgi:hypothetical protein